MLILTRKPGEILTLRPDPRQFPAALAPVLAYGDMEIHVTRLDRNAVRLGIVAHRGWIVMRGELVGRPAGARGWVRVEP